MGRRVSPLFPLVVGCALLALVVCVTLDIPSVVRTGGGFGFSRGCASGQPISLSALGPSCSPLRVGVMSVDSPGLGVPVDDEPLDDERARTGVREEGLKGKLKGTVHYTNELRESPDLIPPRKGSVKV
ncbi:hypothetical protein DFJ43DRAFT_1172744 [Lentinula guzmanii]|uniref:Uncharacterized protein n=1 Tax=Lentinula guzmanii TaxID=2804957 RepID=A0AA38MV27_9AGAR|nr:hypothetical protein DFJ43DRAFT_1172744 [Lentinula guzmanii]